MATYFLDTSAIVKRYIPEQGQIWIVTLCDPAQKHDLYISQAALVEVVSAICWRAYQQRITIDERDKFIAEFRQHSRDVYNIWPVTDEIYELAGNLCRSYRLRAYDAVQLACLLKVRDDTIVAQAPVPIFVCADNNLIDIALAEGLSVENPNNYL